MLPLKEPNSSLEENSASETRRDTVAPPLSTAATSPRVREELVSTVRPSSWRARRSGSRSVGASVISRMKVAQARGEPPEGELSTTGALPPGSRTLRVVEPPPSRFTAHWQPCWSSSSARSFWVRPAE